MNKDTFKHDVELIGKTSQVNLQLVPLLSELIHLVSQGHLLLFKLCGFFLRLVDSSLQIGIFLFQFAD